jgi:hypothetical protein
MDLDKLQAALEAAQSAIDDIRASVAAEMQDTSEPAPKAPGEDAAAEESPAAEPAEPEGDAAMSRQLLMREMRKA